METIPHQQRGIVGNHAHLQVVLICCVAPGITQHLNGLEPQSRREGDTRRGGGGSPIRVVNACRIRGIVRAGPGIEDARCRRRSIRKLRVGVVERPRR